MINKSRWILGLVLFLGQVGSFPPVPVAQAATPQPVVHALLFWMEGCPNCKQVLAQFVPEVQALYGNRLELRLEQVVTVEDVDRLYQVGQAYGLPRDAVGVPLLLVGDRILVGADQIPQDFAALVDQYLASGGVDFPQLDNLPPAASSAFSAEATPQSNGMTLAAWIAGFMLLALAFAAWAVMRAFAEKPLPALPGWLDLAIPVLALAGLGVAIYLTYIESTSAQAVCGPIGDCNAVQKSPYAKVFGVIYVALIGAAGYIAILAAWWWGRNRKDRLAHYAPVGIWGMAVFGTLYSLYLTYLELFVIKAVCIWCISSAVIITLVMLVSLPACTQWLAMVEDE